MPESVMQPPQKTLFSGFIGEGKRVKEFERQLTPWCGSDQVLSLNNGTSALQLGLRMAGVGPGAEVISTPMTSVATNVPVLALGGRIVWADIDPWTGNLDPRDVERKISARTKAIIAVHWGGLPCDLEALNTLATARGVKLIQDACHAFGATYQGQYLGVFSDFTCFSFQAIKLLTTADGGALVCRKKEDYERGRSLRWYGIDRDNAQRQNTSGIDITDFGYKIHMNDVNAVIGIEQLKFVEKNLRAARANADWFNKALSNLDCVRPLRRPHGRQSSCWLYTVRVKRPADFIEKMSQANINAAQIHERNDNYTIFRESKTSLPGVTEFMSEYVCIPVGWWLSAAERDYIVERIIAFENCRS